MGIAKVFYSSELMTNYHPAEVAAPDKKFEALQAGDGRSVLFSIGTDGVFYATCQVSGHATGWERLDLSSTLVRTRAWDDCAHLRHRPEPGNQRHRPGAGAFGPGWR